jgi:hypothetical protein
MVEPQAVGIAALKIPLHCQRLAKKRLAVVVLRNRLFPKQVLQAAKRRWTVPCAAVKIHFFVGEGQHPRLKRHRRPLGTATLHKWQDILHLCEKIADGT